MRTECATDGPIKTDDLHNLKEGEIFVDSESGQKFRVRKLLYRNNSLEDPMELVCMILLFISNGDPNDRTLRRLEADVLIPERMNERVQKVECRVLLESLTRCLKNKGSFIGLKKCQEELGRFNDPWFRQKITDEYIKERSEYRRTGRNVMERKWEDYCEYKKKQGDWADFDKKPNYDSETVY
ncbi:Ribosomal protein L24e [Dirofilaria immitis]|nr:Ribosomal protein L24e [Dirofilaria immitis]